MDALTFIVEMTKALAWPVVAVVIILIVRRPLLAMLPLVRRLRYGSLELDFGRRVHELAAEVDKELPAVADEPLAERLAQLARLSPRAAVLEAWLALEAAAAEASRREGLDLTSRERRTPLLLGQALEQAGILDEQKLEIFHRLRNLRNAAAHASDFELDNQSAVEYGQLALRLAGFLRQS